MSDRRRAAAKPRATAAGGKNARGRGGTKAAPRRGSTARRAGIRRVTQGDRPYVVALLALLVLVGAMALGPLQNYTAAADRVEALERTREQLVIEVDQLEERRARLHDPEEIENRARTQLNLVRPGEIPFVVVTPEEAAPQVGPERPEDAGGEVPWYRRLGRWLAERAGAGQ